MIRTPIGVAPSEAPFVPGRLEAAITAQQQALRDDTLSSLLAQSLVALAVTGNTGGGIGLGEWPGGC